MLKRITIIGLCVLPMLFIASVMNAQEEATSSDWQSTVFEWDGTVIRIDAEGVVSEVVVEEYADGFAGYDWSSEVAISENAEVMAFGLRRFTVAGDDRVVIADLVNDICCTMLQLPSDNADFNSNIAINSDGTILVTAYFERDEIPEGASMVRGDIIGRSLIAYDLTTNPPSILSTLDMHTFTIDGLGVEDIRFGRWQDGSVELASSQETGYRAYTYITWNPTENTLTDTPQVGDRDGVIAEDTEVFEARFDDLYPVGEFIVTEGAISRAVNTVYYSASPASEEYVIFNSDEFLFTQAILGMGGEAVLIPLAFEPDVVVLYRDGTSVRLSVDANDIYIWHGTPEGWIIQLDRELEDENPRLVHLTVDDDTAIVTPIIDDLRNGSATFLINPPVWDYTFETPFTSIDE